MPPIARRSRRDRQARCSTLEKGDISQARRHGLEAARPITVKARDGKTDLYGLMYVPTNLDSSKKYPIINNIYPGPQTGSVGPSIVLRVARRRAVARRARDSS